MIEHLTKKSLKEKGFVFEQKTNGRTLGHYPA